MRAALSALAMMLVLAAIAVYGVVMYLALL